MKGQRGERFIERRALGILIATNRTVLNKDQLKKDNVMKKEHFKVMIASPADTSGERKLLLSELANLFDYYYGSILDCGIEVNGWEGLPSKDGFPQDMINEILRDRADFIVGVFRSRLGTPVKFKGENFGRSQSGAEAIQATFTIQNAIASVGSIGAKLRLFCGPWHTNRPQRLHT